MWALYSAAGRPAAQELKIGAPSLGLHGRNAMTALTEPPDAAGGARTVSLRVCLPEWHWSILVGTAGTSPRRFFGPYIIPTYASSAALISKPSSPPSVQPSSPVWPPLPANPALGGAMAHPPLCPAHTELPHSCLELGGENAELKCAHLLFSLALPALALTAPPWGAQTAKGPPRNGQHAPR